MSDAQLVEIEIDPEVHLPVYRHLEDHDDYDIDLIWGSRDSGKSREVAMRLVEKCLTAEYFRCILARKTFATIKDSQWQLIRDIVIEWGLEDEFTFNTSPLQITCTGNGNKFLARGFDDAQKVKSIQNPSDAWVEEANELTEDDFIVLSTSLRSNRGRTHTFLTLNPECEGDYEKFWIFKNYLKKHYPDTLSFSDTIESEIEAKGVMQKVITRYRSTHSTYQDNPFCSIQRIAIYEGLRSTSPYFWRMYACGMWGRRENKSPFVLTFNRERHLAKALERDPLKPLFIFFDFNRNPMCCCIIQVEGLNVNFLEVIKQPSTTIYQVCDIILAKYPGALYLVGGDFSGINRSALVKNQDEDNYYKVIQMKLGLHKKQLIYEPNPPIEENQVLVNWALEYLNVKLDERKCQPLIFDMENAEVMPNGKLKKLDRDDPTQQLDALDAMRYAFNRLFKELFKKMNPNLFKNQAA